MSVQEKSKVKATIPISLNADMFISEKSIDVLIDTSKVESRQVDGFIKQTPVWKDRQSTTLTIEGQKWEYFYSICITRKRKE